LHPLIHRIAQIPFMPYYKNAQWTPESRLSHVQIIHLASYCGSLDVTLTGLNDYQVILLTAVVYETLLSHYTRATDADLHPAQALIHDVLKAVPNSLALCQKTWFGSAAAEQASVLPPFGPGFSPAIAQRTTHLEYWVTTFDQPKDFVEYRAWDGTTPLATRWFAGY